MNLSISDLLEIVIAAVLRRYRLIITPIVIFGLLSILAVMMWPRQYTAHALLMLQEGQQSDPLGGSSGSSREGRLKAEEIDTLLKSDRVLAGAISDMNAGKKPLSQGDVEGEIRSLRKQLGVSVVGSDFIEIEIKQSEREGIGERLSIILTRFFEHLLTREDSMKTARMFALGQRQEDVISTGDAIEGWMSRARAAGIAGEQGDGKLAQLQKRYTVSEQKLEASARKLLPGVNLAGLDQAVGEEIRLLSSRSHANRLEEPSERVASLKGLTAENDALRELGLEIAQLRSASALSTAQALQQSQASAADEQTKATYKALYNEWELLAGRYADAVDQYDKHVQRAKKAGGPGLTPFGLIAPESIRMIDEPRDPALPTTSLLKILVACLGAGIGLGAGLAMLAEQLDDRIYDSRGLAKLTGVDAVFRVPLIQVEADSGSDADSGSAGERAARRGHLAVVSGVRQMKSDERA